MLTPKIKIIAMLMIFIPTVGDYVTPALVGGPNGLMLANQRLRQVESRIGGHLLGGREVDHFVTPIELTGDPDLWRSLVTRTYEKDGRYLTRVFNGNADCHGISTLVSAWHWGSPSINNTCAGTANGAAVFRHFTITTGLGR